jgi:para-nitrobenzyl esterase
MLTIRILFPKFRWAILTTILSLGLVSFIGCGDDDDTATATSPDAASPDGAPSDAAPSDGALSDGASTPPLTGIFGDSPVAGLNYTTSTSYTGTTSDTGAFSYGEGNTVTISIGNLALGSATGAATLTPLSITSGAADATDPQVNNKLVLLQTLDADGDLNNGIQITKDIRTIVSDNAASIKFDQTTTAFQTSLSGLMTALNTANVFTDTDPRARKVRTAVAALEHFTRATSERSTVTTTYGQLRGYSPTPETWQYLGVPYAKAPLGELRWKAPQELKVWTGVRDAVAWGDQAPQNPAYEAFGEGGMSEDCLYLNITAPKNASKAPVMVWFHGGGFVILTGNTKAFNNPKSLPTKGVILVSVVHRLGPFGYLAHPLLTAESGYSGSGNYGQMDLIAALTWIKNNIANFGGDPNNVTIFGESGGGGKVTSLMNSPLAKGLFHRAISESGQAEATNIVLNGPTLAWAEAIGTKLFNALGVKTLAEARAKTWTDIITTDAAFYPPNGDTKDSYGPVVDNHYQTKSLTDGMKTGPLPNDVPFMGGGNSGDMAGLIPGLVEQMPWRADNNSSAQFVYKFSKVPEGWAKRNVLCYHGCELVYVFNYPASLVTHYLLGLVIDPATKAKPVVGDLNGDGKTGTDGDTKDIFTDAAYGATDVAVTDTVMTMWTNFAKTGNPSTATFTWPEYTTQNDTFVEITSSLTPKTGLKNGW